MNKIEKMVAAGLIAILAVSLSIYGVWEDKATLFAPLISLCYLFFSACLLSRLKAKEWELKTPPGGVLFFLFALFSAALIPLSIIPYDAKISTLRLGCYVGAYWVSANLFSTLSSRKTVWTTLLLVLIPVAIYSVVQHAVGPDRIFGMERYTTYWQHGRLGGTYQCPNHIAHLFQLWLPFCVVFLFLPQLGWVWRIGFGCAIPLFSVLIYQTYSRAGLLGSIASLGTLSLLLMLRKSRKAFIWSCLIAPLLAVGCAGALWAGSAKIRDRMQPVIRFADHIVSGASVDQEFKDFRPQTWLDSLAMIRERPWLGVGPGNYGQVFPEYRHRVAANRLETVHPHNEPIELLAEYGLVGALLWLGALGGLCIPLLRWIKTSPRSEEALPAAALLAAWVGTLVHGFFDFELRIFPNALMVSVLAGTVVAPSMSDPSRRLRFPAFRWVSGAVVVSILLATGFAFQVMGSAGLRVRGDQLRLSGNRLRAEKMYRMAANVDPQNWRAHLGLGQVYSYYRYYEIEPDLKRQWAEKERDVFARAYRHNTKREKVVYGLGRAELAAGHRAAGLDRLREAAHYKRFNDFYWRKLGIELRKAGLYDEALETFLYAQKLDRSNRTVRRNIAWLKEQR